jgi:hypothetical protein
MSYKMMVSYLNTTWCHNTEGLDLIFNTMKTSNLALNFLWMQFAIPKCLYFAIYSKDLFVISIYDFVVHSGD